MGQGHCLNASHASTPPDKVEDERSDVDRAVSATEVAANVQQDPISDRMPARSSLLTVYLLNFLMVANFTVLVPKTKEYWEALGGDPDTGLALTRLLPILKAVMAWWFLWLSRKNSVRAVIDVMVAGNVIGNIIYAMSPVTGSRWSIFVARLILTSHEVQSVPNCYIGRAVGMRYRSEAAMHNNAWFGFGFAAGPLIAYVLERMAKGFALEGQGADILDAETLPGWFMALLWLVFLGLHKNCFKEPALEEGEEPTTKTVPRHELPWPGIVVVSIISFTMALLISSWEMWTMVLVQDRWGSPLVAGGYLAANMMAMLPVALISGRISRFVDDSLGLLVALTTAGGSFALLFQYFGDPYYETKSAEIVYYSCGSVGLLASMQFGRGFLDAIVSKLCPAERKQQLITAAMSIFMLGRGVGGSLGAWFVNQNSWAAFHMAVCLLSAGLTFVSMKMLRPYRPQMTTGIVPAQELSSPTEAPDLRPGIGNSGETHV